MASTKSATVIARVEPDTKREAEMILEKIGIPASVAINMFYKKIIQTNGIPFSLNLNPEYEIPNEANDVAVGKMISKGYEQARRGEGRSTKDITNKIRETNY